MRPASEVYQDSDYGWYDYQPMLKEFGKIVIQVDDDYQGDSRVLYRKGRKFGHLQFGWGSCSGCDALQACSDMDEIQELMDDLQSRIIWFNSAKAALKYFQEHDWEGDYSWYAHEQKDYIEKVINYLQEAINGK